MKRLKFSFLFFTLGINLSFADVKITGRLDSNKLCQANKDFLLVLSHPKNQGLEYLYQIELPNKGEFEFVVKPGEYFLEAVSSTGCIKTVKVLAKVDGKNLRQNILLDSKQMGK